MSSREVEKIQYTHKYGIYRYLYKIEVTTKMANVDRGNTVTIKVKFVTTFFSLLFYFNSA